MARNLKALGLTLVALVAISALTASAAQAQGKFTWPLGTTKLTTLPDKGQVPQTGWQQWGFTFGKVQCQEVSEEAVVSGTEATEVEAGNISYTGCTGPFGEATTVEFNGCKYLYTVGATIGVSGMETTGQTHIRCPVGKQITMTGAGGFCQIHIPEQTPKGGHIVYKTITGTPNHVTKELTLTGITYQGTGLCTSGTDGQYLGNYTVKAYKQTPHEPAQQVSVEVH